MEQSSQKRQKKVKEIKNEMKKSKSKKKPAKVSLYKLMPEIFRCLSYLEQRNKTPDPIFTDSSKQIERAVIEEKFVELL